MVNRREQMNRNTSAMLIHVYIVRKVGGVMGCLHFLALFFFYKASGSCAMIFPSQNISLSWKSKYDLKYLTRKMYILKWDNHVTNVRVIVLGLLKGLVSSHFVQRPFRTKTTSYKGDHVVQRHRSHFEQGFFVRGGTWIFTYKRRGIIS